MKTKDEGKIGMFQEALQEQKDSKMIKDSRIKMHQKYKEQLEREQRILEQNHIELRVLEKKNQT